jgi:hypothetical protein
MSLAIGGGGECYDRYFRRFWAMFGEKVGDFLNFFLSQTPICNQKCHEYLHNLNIDPGNRGQMLVLGKKTQFWNLPSPISAS